MKLISRIEVRGFRSLQNAIVDNLGQFTALAGLNNSGKSNVLRALNLFFNGVTDAKAVLDLDKDFHLPDLAKKKARRVEVAVGFSLPPAFHFRSDLEPVKNLVGKGCFEIRKVWTRGASVPGYFLRGSELVDLVDRQRLDQFLSLINFRYIPNRVLPLDIIRSEHQSLRDVLVRRLSARKGTKTGAFDAIRDTSKAMIQSLAKRFRRACPHDGEVRMATPRSWQDMAFTFGYRLQQGDVEIEDGMQGSGIQSLLMLETLYLIDQDYFQKFGWRQAAIWAVEEPESSLHSSLEATVGQYLAEIAAGDRLQVFATTHSDIVLQHADAAVVADRSSTATTLEQVTVRDALERCARMGVSHWTHPILRYPLDPVVIVEGKRDVAFIEEAIRHMRSVRKVRVTSLERMVGGSRTGGKDDTFQYIKQNLAALAVRSVDAPVIVLLDWDNAKQHNTYTRLFSGITSAGSMVWNVSDANPRLTKSFRGIERFYPDRIVNEAMSHGAPIAKYRNGKLTVDPKDYEDVKRLFDDVIERSGLKTKDLIHARPTLQRLLKRANAV